MGGMRPLFSGGLRRRGRGSATVLVLAVALVLLVFVVALAGSSLVCYHLAHRHLVRTRARLLAEGAVQDFLYRFALASRQVRRGILDLESREVDNARLDRLYPDHEGLPHPPSLGAGERVRITFDPREPRHSTDNSCGEYAAASGSDGGTPRRSVPPFSVDLVVCVTLGGSDHVFEALVNRRWPYAAFCARSSVAVSGSPAGRGTGPASPARTASRVDGSLASLAEAPAFSAESERSYDLEIFQDVFESTSTARSIERALLAAGRVEDGRVYLRTEAAITVGAGFVYDLVGGGGGSTWCTSPGNRVTGSAFVGASLDAEGPEGVRVAPENTLSGERRAGIFPEGLTSEVQPVDVIHLPPADDPGLNIIHLPLIRDLPPVDGGGRPPGDRPLISRDGFTILDQDLVIDPDAPRTARVEVVSLDSLRVPSTSGWGRPAPAASPEPSETSPRLAPGHAYVIHPRRGAGAYVVSGGQGNRFVLHGSLGNRRVNSVVWTWQGMHEGHVIATPPTRARLVLRNCTLLVNGSLDLSGDAGTGIETGLEGSNATLIVDGSLVLGAGRLSARDQGMVLYARNIIMRARGEYKGLIVSQGALHVLTPSERDDTDDHLRVSGALLAGGAGYQGLVIRSTHLVYDGTYVKPLHAFGEPTVVRWREIP